VALGCLVAACTSVLGVEDLHFVDAGHGTARDAQHHDSTSTKEAAGARDAGRDAGTDGDSGGKTAAEACADYGKAWCAKTGSCPNEYYVIADYPNEASCETRTAAMCVSSLAAAGTGLTPDKVEACSVGLPGESCIDFRDNNPAAACAPAVGNLMIGAPCGDPSQCVTGSCEISPNQVCGTCQLVMALGAPCQPGWVDTCGPNLACLTSTLSQCSPYVADGAECLGGVNQCFWGSVCVGSDTATMTMGTCQVQGSAAGAVCDTSVKTKPNCSTGFDCIPAMAGATLGMCKASTLVTTGATCGSIGSNPITGVADCTLGSRCYNHVCVAPAVEQGACNTSMGPPCLTPAKCVPSADGGTAGTCIVPDATRCM
jgi:hypothetical protein